MNKNNTLKLDEIKSYINSKLNKKPIILVGMMGVGKSAIGKLLANDLNKNFYDIDTSIEKTYNLKVHEIFELYGEEKFRELEYKEIKNIKKDCNLIIATGGGAFAFKNNYKIINKIGLTIWIKAEKNVIIKRVSKNINKRPLLKNKNLSNHINNLLKDRNPLYAKAHIHVESLNETKIKMKNKVLVSINNYLKVFEDD
tara:strand:- start:778 stop:1371 length:594 start_codon:yes stop_codon:yes gene_type:complete